MRKVYLSEKERSYLKEKGFGDSKSEVRDRIRQLQIHIPMKNKAMYLTGLNALPEKLKTLNHMEIPSIL